MLEGVLRRAKGLRRPAVIAALALTATSAWAVTLTRGPYLQLLTTDSATVVWNTDDSAACSLAIRPLGGASRIVEGGEGDVCAIAVDGLFPGAHYSYTPRADGAPVDGESIFHTDDPFRPFTFLVLGDSGDGSADQYAVAERMEESPADLILHTGDMVYEEGAAVDYDPHYFVPYKEILRRLVLWPCLGEDDTLGEGRTPWLDAFYTPANNPKGLEEYYSFDYGNAHFVVLDTTHDTSPGSPMHEFLDADLAASRALWKFVFMHKPIYTSRTSTLGRRRDVGPIFDRHHVDIVFNGDVHTYERTKSMKDERVVADGEGTVYVTTGGGGKSHGTVTWSEFTAYTESAFHFVRVSVDGKQMLLEMVRDDGQIRDTMPLAKERPASCGDGEVDERAEQCDGNNDDACPGVCADDCSCPPLCGDGVVNQPTEECDVADDALCPGRCLLNCECADPLPVLELAPIADTYIDAAEANWDHGIAGDLAVDGSPERITYLKFDLGAMGASVLTAKLALYVTDASDNGGTVYAVADSSWVEGDRNGAGSGSAGGPGLKWIEVDTDDDGEITAEDASPYVPDFSQPIAVLGSVAAGDHIEVDVTAAFQRGPDTYTLAVRSQHTEKTLFASREDGSADRRPVLLVELGGSSCMQDDDCDDGFVCTLDYCHPVSQTCFFTPDHGACANGRFCDGMERCEPELGCVMPVASPCDDGVVCTIDSCNETGRVCEYTPDPTACDDGDPCTVDACDASAGCQHTDSGLCRSLVADLVPMADTFVETGDGATWDHGAGPTLDIDDSPKRITYLKFDLRGTTPPVSAATLMLHCINGTPDGGTIYPVADSSWIEGDRDGADSSSAGGPGLTFSDLDANGDGELTVADTSPYLPDLAQPIASIGAVSTGDTVSADVTAALQGGPRVYTLAIVNEHTNKGQYASRENADKTLRPHVKLGLVCITDADCDDGFACTKDTCHAGVCVSQPDDGRCDDGIECTVDRCDLGTWQCVSMPDNERCDNGSYCDGAEACDPGLGCLPGVPIDCDDGVDCTTNSCDETLERCVNEPDSEACNDRDACTTDACDPVEGCRHVPSGLCETVIIDIAVSADTFIEGGVGAAWDHGAATELKVDLEPARVSYFAFDLSALRGVPTAATLTLYCTDPSPDGGTLYPVGNPVWVEGNQTDADGPGLKFVDVDTNGDGAISAADVSPLVPDFGRPIAVLGPVEAGQVVSVDVTSAFQGTGIYTLALKNDSRAGAFYASREVATASRRPRLRVELPPVPPCNIDADCDDGILCTLDWCDDGVCSSAPDHGACDDGIPCTIDRCDVTASACLHTPDDAACDNGVFCDGPEACDTMTGCVAGKPVDCDDLIACTVDTCDEASTGCLHAAADTACNDGNLCTTDTCDPLAGCEHGSSGLCEPVALDLEPVADTYIESGAQAVWDHGAAEVLWADLAPVRLTYLKFDLTAITQPVASATLTLHCQDPSPDGGTVYPVRDSSWVEGTQTGAAGPGLTFSDVDTNGDGAVTAADASPYVPDFTRAIATLGAVDVGQTVSVDVTAALQGGAGVYTLALKNHSRSGGFYASREVAEVALRPLLHLVLPPVPPCATDDECDDGIACTADQCEAGVCANRAEDSFCNDGLTCTVDTCDVAAGRCVHAPDDTVCNNAVFCDGVETCDVTAGCVAGVPVDCDDGIICTVDSCDEAGGRCLHAAADAVCDDGDLCTTDTCDPTDGCQHPSNGLCEPVELDLEPVADTYIEGDGQATWDHGAATVLKVDMAPARMTYLKFDLTAITEPVESATLTLHCTNASPDGGTVYPVRDSSWVEGDQTGGAGSGMKFIDVDIDGDGNITASDASPYVPDFTQAVAALGSVAVGQTVSVDVTAALQAGPGVYTLAVKNDDRSGAAYASRETADAALRPVLHVVLPVVPPCAADAHCDDGVACTVDRCSAGACIHTAEDSLCDDGVICTVDSCDAAAGGCLYELDDVVCDNGVFCDGVEQCDAAAGCVSGPPVDCDDGITCTVDTCDEAGAGCLHETTDVACDDGDVCTADACDPAVGCQHPSNGLCEPTELDLQAAADTYIEGGAQATWDHGAAPSFKVDLMPFRVTYLKFDLTAISEPIMSATLTLHCVDPASDGGTVYPVADSSWVEGAQTGADSGSAAGPGLKFVEVDTDGDGEVTALDASPYVPDFTQAIASLGAVVAGQTVRVDVTAALQGDQTMYTLAVKNDSKAGAFYASREAAEANLRPVLHLRVAPALP